MKAIAGFFSGEKRDKRLFALLVIAMLGLILITRVAGIRHGLDMHTDEYKFEKWASSVVYSPYEADFPDYPNGAILFQIPFHLVFRALGGVLGRSLPTWVAGRVASIVYFMLGSWLGIRLCWKLSGKNLWAAGFYAAIMVFSLFHLEQSRYNTGDAISLFVIMSILTVLDIYIRERNEFYLYFSALLCGVVGAIKFPLLLFVAFPIAALAGQDKARSRLRQIVFILLFMVLGLLLFSPKLFENPAFFQQIIFKQLNNYVANPDISYTASPLNNVVTVLVYHLFFSDFPLALPFAVLGCVQLNRRDGEGHHILYTRVVPGFILFFIAYNIFAGQLLFRSIYPYFYLCNIYTALGLAAFMQRKRWQKTVVLSLGAFMAVRGGMFTYALMQPSNQERAIGAMTSHENWDERNIIVNYGVDYLMQRRLSERRYTYSYDFYEDFVLLPGEFGISVSMDTLYTRRRILPDEVNTRMASRAEKWEQTKADLEPHLIGKYGSYFDYIFYGMWLSGSTLNEYEFPIHYVYYNGDDVVKGDPPKLAQYMDLYKEESAKGYFAGLDELENAKVLVTGQWLDADEMEKLATYLPVDLELLDEAGYGFVMVMDSQGEVEYCEFTTDEIRISLLEEFGIDVELRSGAKGYDEINFKGRDYSLHYEGLNIAVYDEDFECMMDWFSLFYLNQRVVYEREPPSYILYGLES